MEWLIFAAKSSFMDSFPLGGKLELLLLTGLVLAGLALAPFLVFRILGCIQGSTRRQQKFSILAALIPAFILGAQSLLPTGNVTHAVF
jgi:hypothetical protein